MNTVSRNAILVSVVAILGLVIVAIVVLFAIGKQLPQTAATIDVVTTLVGPTIAILLVLLRTEQVNGRVNGLVSKQEVGRAKQEADRAHQQATSDLVAASQAAAQAAQAAAVAAQQAALSARPAIDPVDPLET